MIGLIGRAAGLASGVSPWFLLGIFVGGVAFGATGCWYVQEQRYDRAVAERDSARDQLSVAANDANRWKVAADAARAAVELQNAEAEAARAALAQTERRLAVADAASQAEIASLSADLSKLKERARANPDQTCRLGPLDRDAVRLLVRP